MEDQLAYKLCTPLPMQVLRCHYHKPANIGKVCSEVTCSNKPLMCSKCAIEDIGLHGEHSGKISDIDNFVYEQLYHTMYQIVSFSSEMSRLSNQNKRLYQEFLQNKENVQLLQLLEQGDLHLKQIDDLIMRQKMDIALDMTVLMEKIQVVIQQIKEENMKKLDDFANQYKKAFSSLKENIDSFFLLSRKNFYYSNTNTFQYKLASLPPLDAQKLIQGNLFYSNQSIQLVLKHHLNLSKTLNQSKNATPLQILTDLQTLARFLQKMTNQPPNYDKMSSTDLQSNMMESVVREVGQVLSGVISGRLFVPVGGQREQSQVLTGDNNLQIQVEAKNTDEQLFFQSQKYKHRFFLKPSKKYQLDFPIQSVLVIHDNLFAMASANDSILRLFDIAMKKIVVYQGHTEQITNLEKIITEGKSRQFASISTDKTVIIWDIEDITQSNVPRIFRKFIMLQTPLISLDMKDQTHLAVCDGNREISVCQINNQKIGNYGKTRHLSKINGLVLLKKGERFLSYSSDSIINIWRIMKGGTSQEPVIVCDQTLHDPLYGSISQVFITTQWSNQAILVNTEGEIKIFDLSKQTIFFEIIRNCVVFSQFGKRKLNSQFIESILIEEADRKSTCVALISPTNWILAFSFNDNVAVQYRLTNQPFTMHSQDTKIEHKLYPQGVLAAKHKIQLYQTGQSISQSSSTNSNAKLGTMMVMFANEQTQDLLVYELKGK